MPIDPRHGRRVPAGTRLARVLARVLAAMRRHAARELAAGRVPDFGVFAESVAGAVAPLLAHEWVLGVRQARGDLRARRVGRARTKGVGDVVASGGGGTLGVGRCGGPSRADNSDRPRGGDARGGLDRRGRADVRVKAVGGLPPPLTPDSIRTAWDVFRPEAVAAARRLALELAGEVTEVTRRRVREVVASGIEGGRPGAEIARDLAPLFGPERALTIAQSETSRSMHAGEVAAYEASGVVGGLEWLASSDACERCRALNGKRVKLGEPFYVDPKGGPYAIVKHAPLHPRCMCSCKAVIKPAEGRPEPQPRAVPVTPQPAAAPVPAGAVAAVALPGGRPVGFVPHPSARAGRVTVLVPTAALDAAWSRDEGYYIPPGGGGAEIGGRRDRVREFLATGKPVQASRASLGKDGVVSFEDGRHRASVLRDLGLPELAVTIDRRELARWVEALGARPVHSGAWSGRKGFSLRLALKG